MAWRRVIGLGAALALLAGGAWAQTKTAQFNVTASVYNDCQVQAADLAFGTYSSSAASSGTTTIIATCTPGAVANISLSGGSSGNPQSRTMKNGSATLSYQLYKDSAHQNAINTAGQAFTYSSTGAAANFPVYGQIPASQTVAAGNYVDTIQVSVQF